MFAWLVNPSKTKQKPLCFCPFLYLCLQAPVQCRTPLRSQRGFPRCTNSCQEHSNSPAPSPPPAAPPHCSPRTASREPFPKAGQLGGPQPDLLLGPPFGAFCSPRSATAQRPRTARKLRPRRARGEPACARPAGGGAPARLAESGRSGCQAAVSAASPQPPARTPTPRARLPTPGSSPAPCAPRAPVPRPRRQLRAGRGRTAARGQSRETRRLPRPWSRCG